MTNLDYRACKGFPGIHRYFADFMVSLPGSIDEKDNAHIWLASALVSYFVNKGHICINLQDMAGRELYLDEDNEDLSILCPPLEQWIECLKRCHLVGDPYENKPLILTEDFRLYLNRYWQYERIFIDNITKKINFQSDSCHESLTDEILERLFPPISEKEEDMQRKAAQASLSKNFLVISGGPGTGKTYTIVKIIALLMEMKKIESIALVAPTGKAAARLKSVIRDLKDQIDCPDKIKTEIPDEALTVHRLLGASTRTKSFKFHENNPLPHDAVIVDEASMIDLPLMAKFLSAIPQKTKLILVGDKDQLSSVEPGAVFGDICKAVEGIPDSIVILKKNYRFHKDSGIGLLSEKVKQGNGEEAIKLIKDGVYKDIVWRDLPSPDNLYPFVEKNIVEKYYPYIKSTEIEEAFEYFDSFHVICALRKGPYGVIAINGLIEKSLKEKGLIKIFGKWYRCKPIMITANDYNLKLFNGDTGIVFQDKENRGLLRIFFRSEDDGIRKIAPPRIADYETAYAITVHKSQGSEFKDIVIILSDRQTEILTRELIYTAITRAKRHVEIWGREDVFVEAVKKRIKRQSGIKEALISIHQNRDL